MSPDLGALVNSGRLSQPAYPLEIPPLRPALERNVVAEIEKAS